MSIDGLAMLDAERAKKSQNSRRTPPPKTKKSVRTVPPPQHTPKPRTATVPVTPTAATQPTTASPVDTAVPGTSTNSAAEPELRRVTVYLEAEAADFLDAVLLAGRPLKPRVNSASAVIRLAISRLAEQTSAQEVAETLRDRAAAQGNQSGRKRV